MLISDFPFVRSVHLLGKRLFGALFPPYGWRPVDPGERNSSPREEPCTRREQLSPRREVSESIDRPIDRQSEAVERCAKTRRESERALAELLPNLPPPSSPSAAQICRHCPTTRGRIFTLTPLVILGTRE
jgi:hypothetical protein